MSSSGMDDPAKGGLTQFETFYLDTLRVQRNQMIIKSVFQNIYVSS